MTHETDISKIDWKKNKVDVVLECTGKFNTNEKSKQHINSGAKKVIVSAPCKGATKVVSMPCQELFDKQSKEYKEKIIEKNSIKISIEAGSIFGWEKYVGSEGISLGIRSFGKSAPLKKLYENFGLTSNNVTRIAKKMLEQ
jgi:transketolase